jgi:hypothetical protein
MSSRRGRRRNPITSIELRVTLHGGQRGRENEEILVRSKDPLVVIEKARNALESLGGFERRPKAFKQSNAKSGKT